MPQNRELSRLLPAAVAVATPAAFRVRTFGCTSFVVDPLNGQIPPVTPSAAARRKAEVIISDEMIHDTRVIPLDGRPGARNRRQ